jgi:nucleoside-diphosphate-sugar epimerase
MITVMGATGHTGRKIAVPLQQTGEKIRALGRNESKLAELKSAGAEVLPGDANNAVFLAINERTFKPRKGRTMENTTPTRFEDFAGELARAYQEA